jgi:sugar phosphate isomerase/epimerase
MLSRRKFFEKGIGTISAGAAFAASQASGAGQLAWPKPIGLELYTVRQAMAQNPGATLKKVAAVGYKEVEIGPDSRLEVIHRDLRAVGLAAPSGYFDVPKTLDPDWKKAVHVAHLYGLRYLVVGDNPTLDAEAWRRRADFFNDCGRLARHAGIQFCYHAHFHEFAPLGNTSGYDIMLTRCDPELLKMEMDIFWAVYAGQDPIAYFQKYPGRFPLLHIKDFKPGFPTSTKDFPYDSGPNPFAPAGQGRIDWAKIFAHTGQAGTRHVFVEQDRCDGSPFAAIKTSFNYLKNLRLS